jgi:hypothetical protein
MKNSIAMTLVITAGIFGFVSGYSIGTNKSSDQGAVYKMTNQKTTTSSSTEAPAGGYGKPAVGGYGTPTPATGGYGKPAAAGYGTPAAATGGYGKPAAAGYGSPPAGPKTQN